MRKTILNARRRFTLIEMLVVIAIISILASLLAPSLQKARHSALGTVCLNNMRSIAAASGMYLTAHQNRYIAPPLRGVSGDVYGAQYHYRSFWARVIGSEHLDCTVDGGGWPQRKAPSNWGIFRCPSDPVTLLEPTHLRRSYSGFAKNLWINDGKKFGNNGKISRIKNPSKRYLAAEVDYNNTSGNEANLYSEINCGGGSSKGEAFLKNSDTVGPNHVDKAAFSYLDQHCKLLNYWTGRGLATGWADYHTAACDP